jgi:hypothetical protein
MFEIMKILMTDDVSETLKQWDQKFLGELTQMSPKSPNIKC